MYCGDKIKIDFKASDRKTWATGRYTNNCGLKIKNWYNIEFESYKLVFLVER